MDTKKPETRQAPASTEMWLIRSYSHDLSEHFAGDEARFSRMVLSGGISAPTASPHGWARHITNCTTNAAVADHRAELLTIYRNLMAWGLVDALPESLK